MGSREEILAAIRKRQGRGGRPRPRLPSASSCRPICARIRAGRCREVAGDLAARFRARAEASASTCDRVAAMAEAPGAVARYLGRAPAAEVRLRLAAPGGA